MAKVIIFVQIKEVISPFGFIKLLSVEKNGVEISKNDIGSQEIAFVTAFYAQINCEKFRYEKFRFFEFRFFLISVGFWEISVKTHKIFR